MLMQEIIDRHGFNDFRELHQWSFTNPGPFWREAWSDLGIVGDIGERSIDGSGFENTRWFPDARLNVVETLLNGEPDIEVLVGLSEDGPRRSLTREELRREVAACAAALRASGVTAGDRVAAWTPNVIETVIFALGALAIGAVVSTASTDFGPSALVDRFGQIAPTVLLVASTYRYGGKEFALDDAIDEVAGALPAVKTIVVLGTSEPHPTWTEWLEPHRGARLEPVLLRFDHPGFILFSSGTTGKPKCIVHSAAGVLLKVLSEQGYHLDINPGDRVLYATTCGWNLSLIFTYNNVDSVKYRS
jgi:acetoacetyl-CoA synthetase